MEEEDSMEEEDLAEEEDSVGAVLDTASADLSWVDWPVAYSVT